MQKPSSRHEPTYSKEARQKHPDDWEPDWIDERYGLKLVCNNTECGEIVLGVGNLVFEQGDEWDLVGRINPECFFPAPALFKLPGELPYELLRSIESAFRLYWADLPSCANKIRICVENILDDQGVAKFPKKGKRKPIPTHNRIEKFKKMNGANVDITDHLLAIKWIGNAGSHPGPLTREDVLDGFDMLEHVVETLYNREKTLLKKKGLL